MGAGQLHGLSTAKPPSVSTPHLVSTCSAAQGISPLYRSSYLMYHQPSKFFLITSTVTPFSKPISSLLWLV